MNNDWSKPPARRSGIGYAIGAVLLLAVGFALGTMFTGTRYPITKEPEFKQFNAAYAKILNDYLEGATPEQLINGAAEGMLASLGDPYSQYLAGDKGEQYVQSYEGQFYGIGAEIRQEEGQFVIQSVIKETPAERGGVLPGDVIIAVDGQEVKGKSFQDLLGIVRGEEDTTITLRLLRAGEKEPLELSLKRAAIPVHTVQSERLEGGIGHITINRFAENTAEEFKSELEKLEQEGALTGLLLDLRSNPGGQLKPTLDIANMLVPEGKKILDVVYKEERKVDSYLSRQEEEWTLPIVVLVNGHSASASEVMAAALKESAGALVVGETTYGKGVVQTYGSFSDGSVMVLTEAQWKTPGGTWINKEGVEPDYPVDMPAFASLRPLPLGAKLAEGGYGDDVKTLQAMLKELGFTANWQEGLFDAETSGELRAFQSREGLEATGGFDDKTGYRLVELLREKLNREDSQLLKGVELLQGQPTGG